MLEDVSPIIDDPDVVDDLSPSNDVDFALDSGVDLLGKNDDYLPLIYDEMVIQNEKLDQIYQQQVDFMSFIYLGVVVMVILGLSKFLDKILFRWI